MPYIDSSIAIILVFIIFILASIGAVLVLWIAMPFALFGVKGLLRNVVEEQERTNRLLEALLGRLDKEKEKNAEKKGVDEDTTGIH